MRAECGFKAAETEGPAKLEGSKNGPAPNEGAGLGDPENNKLVEAAAIKFVTEFYLSKGWHVDSVEGTKCGYDLICRNGGDEDHVEVKGVAGKEQNFMITAGEVNQARADVKFRLFVVTSTLSDKPSCHPYSGKEFLAGFSLSPVQFRAALQGP